MPIELTDKVWRWVEKAQIQDKQIVALEQHSPLGKVLAAGLANRHRDRVLMKEAIEDAGGTSRTSSSAHLGGSARSPRCRRCSACSAR